MARKNKTETEQTRQDIITAARQVFAERGVSRSTLEQIAKTAGVTRGAIYWHFKNKPDLFFAMMEQVSLPLIDQIGENLPDSDQIDPLRNIQESMNEIVRLLQEDDIARTTFEIIILKCEYVDEFASLDNRVLKTGCNFMQILNRAYENAQAKELLRPGLDPALCALDSYTFMKGLIHLWLSDIDGNIIRDKTAVLINSHVSTRYR
ncbi:MAG: TetR family transcriptional regulator [Pseudomonadota bacterium]|nr:TetR family transcriptional regulator [Pseudomonadota bacterium]